jgi:hypothetical protein
MVEPNEDEDRRQEERRGDERREFRAEVGRRDDVPERRGRPRRRLLGAILVGGVLVAVFGWRSIVVGPTRLANAESAQARIVVEDILMDIRLPLLAAPAFGDPVAGDPGALDLAELLTSPQRAELERLDRRLAPAMEAAPRVPGVPEVLAPIRFLMGRERDARLTWEALLRTGDERQVGRARIGLAVVAIRAGLRAVEEQDAQFAFDHAADQLARVDRDHPDADAAAFDLGLIEVLRLIGPDQNVELAELQERELTDEVTLLREAAKLGVPQRWTARPAPLTIDPP